MKNYRYIITITQDDGDGSSIGYVLGGKTKACQSYKTAAAAKRYAKEYIIAKGGGLAAKGAAMYGSYTKGYYNYNLSIQAVNMED